MNELLETDSVLDDSGEPIALSGEPTSEPGMFFMGYTHSLRGHLFEANLASRKLARNVERYLQQQRKPLAAENAGVTLTS